MTINTVHNRKHRYYWSLSGLWSDCVSSVIAMTINTVHNRKHRYYWSLKGLWSDCVSSYCAEVFWMFGCIKLGCTGFDYFISGQRWTWLDLGTQIQLRPELDLRRTCFQITEQYSWRNCWHQHQQHAVSCYKKAVQCSAFLIMSLVAHFDEICGIAMNLVFFFIWVTLIKKANTPINRAAALVLSVINWTYCSCTGIW